MILPASTSVPLIFAACVANGAPGSPQVTPTGTPYNPVEVIVRTVVDAVGPLLDAAAAGSQWVSLPSGTPVGGLETGVPPISTFPAPVRAAVAQSLAAAVGWAGPMRDVLLRGLLRGLQNALGASPARLTVAPGSTAGIQQGAPYQFVPLPLNGSAVSSAIAAAMASDPVFGIGDPSRRVPLVTACSRCTALVWARVTPVAPVTAGISTGALTPLPAVVV